MATSATREQRAGDQTAEMVEVLQAATRVLAGVALRGVGQHRELVVAVRGLAKGGEHHAACRDPGEQAAGDLGVQGCFGAALCARVGPAFVHAA